MNVAAQWLVDQPGYWHGARVMPAGSCQLDLRKLAGQPCAQRLQPPDMVPPLSDRGRVYGAANLNGAGGCRRRLAFVETQHLVVPGKPCEFDETPALCLGIAHDVLIVHFQQRIRRQGRFPVPG